MTRLDWRPFAEPHVAIRLAIVLCGLTVALFAGHGLSATSRSIAAVDRAWRDLMLDAEIDPLLQLASLLELIGGAWVTLPLRILVVVALAVRRHWSRLFLWLAAVVSAQLLSLSAKAIYARPRPLERLSETFNSAFPSGHTTTAAVMAWGLVLLLPPGERRGRHWFAASVWVALVGWSRLYLRDHWLSDVVGGFLLGTTCVTLAGLFAARVAARS